MTEWMRCTNPECHYNKEHLRRLRLELVDPNKPQRPHCHPINPRARICSKHNISFIASCALCGAEASDAARKRTLDRLTADLHDPVPIFRRIAEMARDPRCGLRGDIAAVADGAVELFTKA